MQRLEERTRLSGLPPSGSKDVSRSFGGLVAVEDVNLAVAPGRAARHHRSERRGQDHALQPDRGRAVASPRARFTSSAGTSPGLPPHRRAALGLARTFQITNLFPSLNTFENCLLAVQGLGRAKFAMLRPLERFPALRAQALETLRAVGLEDRAAELVRNLSHGEQRQLEIGLALAARPRVLLLDEPTAGLSPGESQFMADLLQRLDPAMTVLIIEHDMDIALEIAGRVTVLHYGRVVADGSREEVKADPLVREIYLGA